MSEPKDAVKDAAKTDPVVTKVATPAGLTMDQIVRMLIDTQQQLAQSQKQLADAILESRKPYVDPKVLESKRRELEERQKQIRRDQKIKELTKKACPHIRENGTPNIKWQEHSNKIILGVCGSCISQFDATHDAADRELLRRDLKSRKNMGRAGQHAMVGAIIDV